MKRRNFLVLAGSAAAWPFAAGAQPHLKKRLGFPITTTEGDPAYVDIRAAVRARLAELGWSESDNLVLDLRYANGDAGRIPDVAGEILARTPDAVVVGNTPLSIALSKLSRTVPIVFAGVSDPVGTGLVENLARPGGNITGFSSFEFAMVGKWMELLRAASPTATRVGILYNPATAPFIVPYMDEAAKVAAALGMTAVDSPVADADAVSATYAAMGAEPGGSMIVIPDTFTYAQPHREQIIALAARYHLPAIYAFSIHADEGGLMSYGPNQKAQFVRAAGYIDRIFRGANPAELPVQGPSAFDLVVNLETAGAMNLAFPDTLLGQATRVIE